jgi:hypothetical protein
MSSAARMKSSSFARVIHVYTNLPNTQLVTSSSAKKWRGPRCRLVDGGVRERPNRAVSKTAVSPGTVGSNPTSSASGERVTSVTRFLLRRRFHDAKYAGIRTACRRISGECHGLVNRYISRYRAQGRHRTARTEVAALHERRKAVVSAGLTQGFPIYIERAEGAILVDVDGNQILDLGSGIAVTTIGHAVPELVDAVSAQSPPSRTPVSWSPYESYVEVCEELAALTPGTHAKTSALFNSGAEAIENAVKIARLATGRQAIVVFDHAYHGRTNLTMALTAKNMPYKDRFGPFAPEVYRVPMSYPFRDGLSGAEAAALAIKRSRPRSAHRTSPVCSSSRSRARADSSYPPTVSCRRCRSGRRPTASSSSPTRSRAVSVAPATGSPSTTKA